MCKNEHCIDIQKAANTKYGDDNKRQEAEELGCVGVLTLPLQHQSSVTIRVYKQVVPDSM